MCSQVYQWTILRETDAALLPGKLQKLRPIHCALEWWYTLMSNRHHAVCAEIETHYYLLYNPFDLQSISYRLKTPKRWELFLPTSKNLFSHHTWKIPSPIKTPIWNMLHHLTLAFVLSAVFRWVLSRRTM
jgi:hypothetical protein